MPYHDFISKLLQIKDLIVTDIKHFDDSTHIFFHLQRRDLSCPHCGAVTNKVHDYRTSVIKDAPILGSRTLLHYRKRRYHCDCCGRHFTESFPILPKRCRITRRLAFYSIHLLRDTQNVSHVARKLGISPSSIFRRLNDIQYPKPSSLPKVLSIDEFRGNAGGAKFQAILTDPKHHKILDILPDRSQTTLIDYIQGFPDRRDVRYFIMDMNRVYLDIARTFLPKATIVIDRFHVVRYVTWALENVRKRVQKDMLPSKRRYFKRSRRILLSRRSHLSEENQLALEVMLQQSEDLAKAYYLKELFYHFMASETSQIAKKRLHTFLLAAQVSDLEEFNATLTMLANWGRYILNAFDCPYTNGFTEGTNNKIKVIKRNAYGYRNFDNFRNRILLAST